MKNTHLYLLAATLAVIGLGFFLYKVYIFGFPLTPEKRTDVWRVEVKVDFDAGGGPVKAAVFVPRRTGGLIVVDQNYISPGYGITTERRTGRGTRAVYAIREANGHQAIYYRAVIQSSRIVDEVSREPTPAVSAPALEGARRVAADALVVAAHQQSSDAMTIAPLVVKLLKQAHPGDEASFLLGSQPANRRLVGVAVELLQLANIPARMVNGILLAPERRGARFVHWIEFFGNGRWHTLHTADTERGTSQEFLPWWRGTDPFLEIDGGRNVGYNISTSRSYELATRTALNRQRQLEKKLVEYSIFGLPLQVQSLFRVILVIPAGILLLVVLRNVVGVKTFGTFMPVLIALSFRQTGLLWGCIFFSIVVALGLAVRFYLERLKLLLVPRLACIVIVVILTIAMLTIVSYKVGLDRGLSIGLFPIVILTMTIERMTIVWEERGPGEALQEGLGSVIAGVMCYLIMSLRIVEHLFFVFPELLLVVLAGTVLLGRYGGYRLTEIYRFRVLAK